MKFQNKKFLVTGGAGFIGSYMVNALIEKGAEVIVIDNLSTGRKENLNSKAKFYEANIADPNIQSVFKKEKPEFIYHFAFNVLVPQSVKNPLMDMSSIAGSLNILQNAKDYGVKKVIFASSGFIYGNNPKLPIKETAPFEPISPYAIAKYTVEKYLEFFKRVYDLSYVVLRYSTVYGPGQIKGAMADYVRKLRIGKQAEIYGDGMKTRDYIYINDIVQASLLALKLPKDYENPVFNVSTNIETTLNNLYKKIAKLLNKESKPIYLVDRLGEQIRYRLDYSKIRNVLKWDPLISLNEGLRKVIKYITY